MEVLRILATIDYIDIRELSRIVKEKTEKYMDAQDYENYSKLMNLHKKLDLLADYLEQYR